MGFFSRVKKLWVSPEDRAAKALKEYLGDEEQPSQEIAPKAPEHQEAPVQSETVESEKAVEQKSAAAQESKPEPKVEAASTPEPTPAPEPVSTPVVETVVTPEPAPDPQQEAEISAKLKDGKARIIEPVMAEKAKTESDKPQWQRDLTKALQQADPRLSVWLDLILDGIDTAGEDLWARLTFLLKALEAPAKESEDFVARFKEWLDDMDYEHVEEFRSELQYRLALALELEDEEDERSRLFIKLSEGLSKTREQITKRLDSLLSSHSAFDDEFWEEFEEILIMADVGFEATSELVDRMKTRIRNSGETNPENFKDLLRAELDEVFKVPKRIKAYNPPEVVMMIGVNGVGKTTTIAKIAHREQMQGRKVLIVAGDTFRAAAIGQLEIWAKRVGAGFFAKAEGSDPAAVAYEAIDYAVKNGYDLMLLDTAGRLHTKTNLMEELLKIRRVLGKKHDEAPHRSVLVIDATTGQNAMSQTKLFNEAIGVDELILTKLDGTAKGGIMIAVTMQHKIPITFIGLGEKMEDLRPFNGADFAKALLM